MIGETKYFTVTAKNTDFTVNANSAGCSKTSGILITCATSAATVGSHSITITATAKPSETNTVTLNVSEPPPPPPPPDEPEPEITGSIISVVGNIGDYQTQNVVLSKITWSNAENAFTVPAAGQLTVGAGMPIAGGSPSPYVFSFLNQAASGSQLRVALTNYTYTPGEAGVSDSWFYEPSGDGWELKGQAGPVNMPGNTRKITNISYNGDPYLLAADYDSDNNEGGTLWLLSVDEHDNYSKVTTLPIPNNGDYQAHVEDVYVDDSRIYILVTYMDVSSYEYMNSELRQYKLTGDGGDISFEQVGLDVSLGENAVKLVPYTSGSDKYLFIPCIGGGYKGGDNNGEKSSLSMVNITQDISRLTVERKSYVGGAYSASDPLYDFRDIAIAANGTAYILTYGYDSNWSTEWMLYQTTAANLVSMATSVPNVTVTYNAALVKTDKSYSGYFWSIGICSNGTDEYLAFVKGAGASSADTSRDEVHFLKVGAIWSDYDNSGNSIVSTDVLNAGAGAGFAVSAIAISMPGGATTTLSMPY